MKLWVLLLCVLWAAFPLCGTSPLPCPTATRSQGSGKLCATLQTRSRSPCPDVSLTLRDDERMKTKHWSLESLELTVENNCNFMVLNKDEERQRFTGGFYASITLDAIDTQSEFVCVCTKLHTRLRRGTYNDFVNKHVVDIPESGADNNFWRRELERVNNYRLNVKNENIPPRVQSFIPRDQFDRQVFSRNLPYNNPNNPNPLFKSEGTMDVYDVEKKPFRVTPRHGRIVVGLNNRNQPDHFHRVLETKVPRVIEAAVEPVVEGESVAVSVITATEVAQTTSAFMQIINFFSFFFV